MYLCPDQSVLEVQGGTHSSKGQVILINLLKCTDRDYCKSDDEIMNYFAGSYLYVLSNQIRFDFEKYGKDSIIKESTLKLSLLANWQNRKIFEISQTELALQDLAFNFDEVTELRDSSLFQLKEVGSFKNVLTKEIL